MGKKKLKYFNIDTAANFNESLRAYRNIYYNLFRSQFKWTGLSPEEEAYIMRRFYESGTVAAFRIGLINDLAFAPWSLNTWSIYDAPATVTLINSKGSPLIPSGIQVVNEGVVIGYIQSNKQSLMRVVDWYLKRICQVEMVINTNLQLHKMPFLIPVDEGNAAKLDDIIGRVLNDELVIFAEDVDPTLFKSIQTGAPYIIDKLTQYKVSLINELNTYLGINNSGFVQKAEQVNIDELNANNDQINDATNNFIENLKNFCNDIKNVFGIDIKVEATSAPAVAVGQKHEIDPNNKPGPKEGGAAND